MDDVSARLDKLSPQERVALLALLRKRKGEAEVAAAASPRPVRIEGNEGPLSFAQQRLWFLDRLAPGSPLYNVPGALRCAGRLVPAVLAACLSEVVRRHAALRTRFEIRGGGPMQIIEPAAPLPLPVIDVSALPETVRIAEAHQIVRAEGLAPFDLGRPPLLRARLLRLATEEHLLVYVFHHIASDAWSLEVATREVAALYPALLAGRPSPLPELPLQYADFAWEQVHALQGETLERELDYWRPRLAGAPVLELPADRSRPASPSFRGAELWKILRPDLETGLRELARQERVTAFMALLAPVCALLARLAGSEDIVVGTVVAGRDRRNLQGLIGFFVNTLVLRFDLSEDPDCRRLLAQSREVVLGAFAHQALPFEKLVDELGLPRDPYRPPLLRVLFQLFPVGPRPAPLPGLSLETYQLPSETAKFDLAINVQDRESSLVVQWLHDQDLFNPDTVARWAGAFQVLLGAWLEDPALRVSELPLLTAEQRRQLLTAWTPEPSSAGRGRRSLPALFEAQVDRTPEAPAVSADGPDGGGRLTYRELDERANRLAHWLVDAGVVPGDRVALRLDRSADLVVSLLGVLKTGAAYVPLDPSSPPERLAFALEDSGARMVVDATLLEREADAIARQSGKRLGWDLDPELPAYVIYTSGSTGRPKGVIVPHGAVTRLFAATEAWFGFSSEDVWTLFHSYAFDFSVWEIWGALLHGGRLVVVPWSVSRDPAVFLDLLHRERVTVLNQTPSAFRQLGSTTKTFLRFVIFGGEALDPTMLLPWFSRYGDERPRLVNMYGITETTVHVTYRPLTREDASRPASLIGRSIPDLTLHVLDRHLELQPAGVPGEICVGGAGLAHGYLGRPDLTAARFVPDPFGEPGSRLYRSGDLARRRPDSDLEFLGRIDTQVKIRGFRIELGEIEAVLGAHPAVQEAVVLARQDGSSERRLVAYVVLEPKSQIQNPKSDLRESLGRRLPDYMIPADFVVLDRLPLTANGKLDRRALPAPEAAPAVPPGPAHVPPRDALEEHLAGLFRQVLSVPAAREIGARDDFFELGGTSISGAVLVNRLQETLGEIVHVVAIFDHPTVEALAAYVRDEHPAAAARLWGVATSAESVAEAPAGPAEVAEMLRLIVEGRGFEANLHPSPACGRGAGGEGLNPPAVFLLSPPRSGSTLLRVMLGAHPRLFAPPELELLSFQTLAGREAAFTGRDRFWLEGVIRAVMEARSCDAAEAERIVTAATAEGWPTRRFYRELQGWIGGRLLVDKTPSYALDPAVLRRGEEWFAEARYLHLLRHPQATNRSFEEARLDQIFFRRPHRFTRRQLAELIWTVSHRNILDFLAEIPAGRQHTVRFEELVRDPERVLAGVCDFLGLAFDPTMADPYREGAARMADGVRAESRMLGDVKFHTHGKVDAAAAERWRQTGEAPLGAPARHLAAELGYAGGAWEEGGTAPASFAQERLWVLDQLLPGTSTYNIPGAIRLKGSLDAAALARAVNEIVRRHAALRTVFRAEAGRPVQTIEPWSARPLSCADLSALSGEVRDAEVRRLAADEALSPFDLARGPLFRVVLLHLGPREHVALYTMHHIVSDGWSMGIFSNEVAALYEAFVLGRPSPLAELPLQYPDFALRQRGRLDAAGLSGHLEWWKEKLAGLATLELPTDHPRPPVRSGDRGAARAAVYPADVSARLLTFGRGEQATLYMALLAAFQVLLHRISHQDDIAVGSPVANRTERDVEELIGFFVNTLVMRTDAAGDPTFREMLARVRRTIRDALLHQEAPFERVVEAVQPERQLARSPLFQVLFSLQNTPRDRVELPGLALEGMALPAETAKFDLSLACSELPDGLAVRLEFDLDLYEPATADQMLRHLETLLAGALAAPDARLSELPLLAPAERAQLLDVWNRTAAPFPREVPIHRLFEAQADRRPAAVAVISDGANEREDLTYADLDAAANRLGWRLRRLGAGPEVPVLVVVERSPELIVAVLAVLKSGGFFVPFDPAHPRERLGVIASRVGTRLAVTQERSLDLLPEGVAAVCVDRDRAAIAAEPSTRLEEGAVGESLMYVLFTSGSTGEPKGVAVRHRNVCHLLHGNAFSAIGPGETYVVLTAVTFDPSILEVWGTLVHGGRLAVLPPELPGLDELAGFLDRHDVTQMHLTTALFHQMAERRPGRLARLRRLAVGGEALAPALAGRVLDAAPGLLLTNCYGPTEITVICSTHDVAPEDAHRPSMPIGRPVANTALYVLGRRMEPVPVGVWGELFIGGEGVSRGYCGRPDLTADRYVPDPFGSAAGARLYRSGDMVRWRLDGVLDFAGRIDRQVKIRGYRIEPGEIEAALTAHPEVSEAAVLVRGAAEDKRLVAYVAVGEPSDGSVGSDGSVRSGWEGDLRRFLAGRLPEPMVPAAVVVLDRLPLTGNGKVDRQALSRIVPERSVEEAVAPRTPAEEILAGLFVEVLGTERTGGRVSVHDSFFELGGHSLLATRLMAAVRDAFAVELPLRLVFEQPTVEGLAGAIAAEQAAAAPVEAPLRRIERKPGEVHRFPVSFSQLREWILDRLEPGNPAYNIASNLRIGGPLSVPVLTAALQEIVRRHEVFRTAFIADDEEPFQAVLPEVALQVPVIDLSALSGAARETELWRRVRHQAGTGFDLAAAPLLRARVVRLGPEDHALLVTVHHIISDGWSMRILNQELAVLYEAAAAGIPSPLPPLPVQYGDYAVWQRERLAGEALERQTGFWRQRLAGAPPLLELPSDRPRPPVRSSRGGRVDILLPQPLAGRLGELALRHGATLFMVLLAGYQSLLARWSGQDDVVVGTYSGNRPRKELEGLIGFFINTLVLRTHLKGNTGDPSFAGLIGRVREATLEAYAHSDVPFEKLLEILQLPRDPSRTPLFQALLVLQNFPSTRADLSTGVRLSGMAVAGEKSDYDLALWLGEGADGIGGALEYSTDLFDEATAVRFAGQLRTLLEAAVADPERNVWTLPLIGEEEQARQLAAWSRGPIVPSGPPLLHLLVEEQAARTPEAVAVEAGDVRLTYAELVEQARRVAEGVEPGSIVALSAERTPELIVQMLGVLQAGAAYLPIDPAYPRERREYMVADSGAKDIKDDKDDKDIKDESQMSFGSLSSLSSLELAPAYVIYTSGSTGRPKGVVVPHRAISSFVRAAVETYDLAPGDRVLQLASISFDTSAEEIWPALAAGATLVLRPEEMTGSIPHFLREIERLGITVLDLPTAFWHEMVLGMEADDLALPQGLRLVILGGEEALADRLALWSARVGSLVRLVNTYGPTEATIVATRRELTGLAPASVPIGRPIPGARAYVLDRFLAPVPPGVRGELWIGGAGVARGYLGRPDLTAERFLPDPFSEEPGARLYRTGDLAVLRPDGDLVFAGRADRQLKIRGYRIEPGEIEAALRLHPDVRDAVVDARSAGEDRRLVAWIVPREGSEVPEVSALRDALRDRLPEPLVPAVFVPVASLPLSPSGKVDRRALPEPEETRPDRGTYAEPQSALERTIAEIYGDLLRVGRVGLHDNFFDLGGHSLLIVRAHQKLKASLGREIPVLDLFRFPTVAALARHLSGEETGTLRKVQGLAERQRAAQQRQKAAMERLRRPGGPARR